jgi:hypothetical protein
LSKGKINQPLRGKISNQTVELDGKVVQDAILEQCHIILSSTDFAIIGNQNTFNGCQFEFRGQAGMLFELFNQLTSSNTH